MAQALIQLSSVMCSIMPAVFRGEGASGVTINIVNGNGDLSVTTVENNNRTLHDFIVSDSSKIGFGGSTNVNAANCTAYFAIACSLLSSNLAPLFFSAVDIASRGVIFDVEEEVTSAELVTEANVSATGNIVREFTEPVPIADEVFIRHSTNLDLDVQKVFQVCSKIVALKPLHKNGRPISEVNLIDAIGCYERAIETLNPFTAYIHLAEALERTINRNATSNSKYLQGDAFDNEVATRLSVSAALSNQLRTCYNRFKHGATPAQQPALEECRTQISNNLVQLAALTNKAILAEL